MEARRRAANKRRKLKLTGGGIGKNRSRSTETDEEDDEPDEGNYAGARAYIWIFFSAVRFVDTRYIC